MGIKKHRCLVKKFFSDWEYARSYFTTNGSCEVTCYLHVFEVLSFCNVSTKAEKNCIISLKVGWQLP